MKKIIFILALFLTYLIEAKNLDVDGQKVYGKILASNQCTQKTELFVSINDVLLYQLMVPINGTFLFNLKKGNYEFHAANQEGCKSEKIKVEVKDMEQNINIKLMHHK